MDQNIFSMTGAENSRVLDMHSLRGLSRMRCPPAVVITHDQDAFVPSTINPSGDALVGSRSQGGLGSGTLAVTADGRAGVYGAGGAPPSRSGSPRHSKVHPSEGNCLPITCSSTTILSTENQIPSGANPIEHQDHQLQRRTKRRCCAPRARRTTLGFFVTIFTCATWIGITHLLKWAYVIHLHPFSYTNDSKVFPTIIVTEHNSTTSTLLPPAKRISGPEWTTDSVTSVFMNTTDDQLQPFRAPFFTTWIYTACNCFFFPAYVCTRFCVRRKRTTAKKAFLGAIHGFQDKGLSALHFFTRSMFFCLLWVGSSYMLIRSLLVLDATAVMALHASSYCFMYLLSWVILHEQFVGIRIVAVMLCNTGIALLAYMDGVSRTSTLGGVVLASAAAAGLAVHKVLFKKLIGSVTMGQLSLFLTLIGLLSILMLWPIGLTIYLVKSEVLVWTEIPYAQLAGVGALFTLDNVLGNFDLIRNYDTYLKLGTVSAVPVSAVLDGYLYNVVFQGMKLAGVLAISIGFLLILLPDNWPDYITQILRWRWRRGKTTQIVKPPDISQPRSRLRVSGGNLK